MASQPFFFNGCHHPAIDKNGGGGIGVKSVYSDNDHCFVF
jgi:hypothetical protein